MPCGLFFYSVYEFNQTPLMSDQRRSANDEQGIALIIVILIVALGTILVVQMSHSTFLSGRSVGMVERQLQAEYVLKSLINFSVSLIDADVSDGNDTLDDWWANFIHGASIPPDLSQEIGLTPPGAIATIEIVPLESRLNVNLLERIVDANISQSAKDINMHVAIILASLFEDLGFDESPLAEEDHTGLFPGRVFSSKELVANLRDYIDRDNDPVQPYPNFPNGIDGEAKDYLKNGRLDSIQELIRIPGFTPARVRKLTPYLIARHAGRTEGISPTRMNLNFLPTVLIRNLHQNIDEAGAEEIARKARELPQGEEFDRGFPTTPAMIEAIDAVDLTGDASKMLRNYLTNNSRHFQIIASVDFGGQNTFLAQAIVEHSREGMVIDSLTVY